MNNVIKPKSVAVLAIMLLCATPLFSQVERGAGQRQGERPADRQRPQDGQRPQGFGRNYTVDDVNARVDRLSENLELTEEQTAILKDFEVDAYKKNQVERQKLQGDREAMRSYMREQRNVRDAKYKEVLTEEQFKKYQEQQELRRQNAQNRRSQGQNPQDNERPSRGRRR